MKPKNSNLQFHKWCYFAATNDDAKKYSFAMRANMGQQKLAGLEQNTKCKTFTSVS